MTGCEQLEKIKSIELGIPNLQRLELKKTITEKKSIAISCNKGDINTYIEEGWEIKDTKKQEVTCSWKTEKANKGCNINKDKGCKITVPDEIGEQIIYSLEKKTKI